MTEKSSDSDHQERIVLRGALQYEIAWTALAHSGLSPRIARTLANALEVLEERGESDEAGIRLSGIFSKEDDGECTRDDLVASLYIILGDPESFSPEQIVAADALLDILDPDISG